MGKLEHSKIENWARRLATFQSYNLSTLQLFNLTTSPTRIEYRNTNLFNMQ
jgi:hypothetical protein